MQITHRLLISFRYYFPHLVLPSLSSAFRNSTEQAMTPESLAKNPFGTNIDQIYVGYRLANK